MSGLVGIKMWNELMMVNMLMGMVGMKVEEMGIVMGRLGMRQEVGGEKWCGYGRKLAVGRRIGNIINPIFTATTNSNPCFRTWPCTPKAAHNRFSSTKCLSVLSLLQDQLSSFCTFQLFLNLSKTKNLSFQAQGFPLNFSFAFSRRYDWNFKIGQNNRWVSRMCRNTNILFKGSICVVSVLCFLELNIH